MLPFDADEILENLRKERYVAPEDCLLFREKADQKGVLRWLRPLLSVGVRKHFQRFHLRDAKRDSVPRLAHR